MQRAAIFGLLILSSAVIDCGRVMQWPIERLGRGKSSLVRMQVTELGIALDMFRFDTGRYPTNEEGLRALIEDPGIGGWQGPYVRKSSVPLDPWRRAFQYSIDARDREAFDVWSYGADGLPGGSDLDGDCHLADCACREPQPFWLRLVLTLFKWVCLTLFGVLLAALTRLTWQRLRKRKQDQRLQTRGPA